MHHSSHAPVLRKKGYEVRVEHSVVDAIKNEQHTTADLAVLDAASMKTSGTRMARRLASVLKGTPLVLLCPEDTPSCKDGAADAVLIEPFTSRKLLNRVYRLLPSDPQHEIHAGPIRLDTATRVVRCYGRLTRLTPKLISLLKLFIQREGRLVRREELMWHIWHTKYTGDMRTIDVHVSWLRKAIEEDPRSPRCLKTVRGVGYRLDLTKK